jgi:hypothetical protein
MGRISGLLALCWLAAVVSSDAGQTPAETLSHDATGRITIRAVRLAAPLHIDGQLDEAVYNTVAPASDFVQSDPQPGVPATEKSEVWVLFDNDNLYVGARLWESHPERMVANEMRKDSANVYQNENITLIFDTFHDQRNAVGFLINPIGGRQDGQITNERWNRDWNAIWDFATGRFDGGWTFEIAVPFKSLRYRPGAAQVWGFNARRVIKYKNEMSHLTPVPQALGGNGVFYPSLAATLVGLEVPAGSRNLEIKPYAVSNLTTDRLATPQVSNKVGGDLGLDVKYGVTQNLIADFTYNTDFAQVEADEQQVNLTRFSLFFPEKREFFLENPGLFTFGGIGTGNQGTPTGEAPLLFYSRRIGLNQGRVVPIDAGGRLTGRVGRYAVGFINIQTGESVTGSRPTNFSVLRLRRDVLRKSSIGIIATERSVSMNGRGSNAAYGVDGVFSFFDNLGMTGYWARTRGDRVSGEDISYRAQLDYGGDRYGLELERLVIGEHFNPEVGFLRRNDIRRSFGSVRFSPRPRSNRLVRRFSWTGSLNYTENGRGQLDTRDAEGAFAIEFNNSDRFTASHTGSYELVTRPFRIAPGVVVPAGGYDSANTRIAFTLGTQRVFSGTIWGEHGSFYSGRRDAAGVSAGRLKVTSQLAVEPTYSRNRVDLLEGIFTTHLAGSRITYTMTPLMFASALLQYNSTNRTIAANVRMRWEYRPGSELFLVYNEERDTLTPRFPDLANRSFIIKVNRLLRF